MTPACVLMGGERRVDATGNLLPVSNASLLACLLGRHGIERAEQKLFSSLKKGRLDR